jgi:hypothetical protein
LKGWNRLLGLMLVTGDRIKKERITWASSREEKILSVG